MVRTQAIGEMLSRREELKERVVDRAQEAKAKGAELMMITEISICPVEFSAKELSEATKMPVIEGMGCAVAVAELFHRLGVPPQPGTAAAVVELASSH